MSYRFENQNVDSCFLSLPLFLLLHVFLVSNSNDYSQLLVLPWLLFSQNGSEFQAQCADLRRCKEGT